MKINPYMTGHYNPRKLQTFLSSSDLALLSSFLRNELTWVELPFSN